jgi:hypothetical protein
MLNTKRTKNLCAAVALAAAVATAHAGSGPAGFSTEITQLANKVELVSTAASTAKTVTNTLQTVMHLAQSLHSMDPAVVAQMMGVDIDGLNDLIKLHDAASDLQQSYEQTAQVLDGFRQLSINTNMSPGTLLDTFAKIARQKGGVYQQAYKADMDALARAQKRAEAFNDQAKQTRAIAADKNIAANLNNLAVINQRTAVILQDLTSSVQRANALAAQAKAEELAAAASFNDRQKAEMDRFIAQQSAVKLDWNAPKREDLLKGAANTENTTNTTK